MTPDADPEVTHTERLSALEDALRARTFELDVLYELSAKLGESLSYEQLALVLLTHLGEAVRYDVAASLLTAPDGGHNLHVRAVRPLTPASREELEGRLIAACSRLTRSAIRREDIRAVLAGEGAAGPAVERFGSFFQVPIIADGTSVGLLFIGAAAEEQFEERHLRLVYTVANQAAAALRRMQEFQWAERRRLAAVVRHLPDGVVLLDAGLRVVLANPAGQQYLEALGDGRPGEVLTRLGGCSVADLARGQPHVLTVPGSPPRTVAAAAVRLDHGLPESWLLVLRDETEVREAVRRRDAFLAMLGHELRNPLAAVTTATELLRRPGLPPDTRDRATDILTRQFTHLRRLVDDILDTSRFLHGKIPVERKPIDLVAVLDLAARAHAPGFAEAGKRLEVELPPGPVEVEGDEARLRQVFDNLLGNARKFTAPGGGTRIACRRDAGEAVVSVRDDGVGIPADKQAAIFEPFVQIDDTLDRPHGGLGLGLAVVKWLVEAHGGRISVRSDGPGRGSEFVLRLPTVAGGARVIDRTPAPAAPRRMRVLLVEDDPDVRTMIESLLALAGHDVVVAGDGYEALSAFRDYRPDVSFIDLGLPGLDGFRVAESLRDDPHRPNARLVALSGYAQPADLDRSRRAGFDHHLAKPVQLADLEPFLGRE
jgi:signal transduction histidine kinase/CheY-like chemotaxis protein